MGDDDEYGDWIRYAGCDSGGDMDLDFAFRQPYAANGVTITFAKKWRTTLDVGGQQKQVVEFMGAVGNILFKIDEMC